MAAENNLHQGHRERMRERIAQQGFESLADHEALEVLLYLTNPRKNTNVMAHALLKRFGSFSRVLDAEEEELCKVEGVGPATARMLHLMPEICKYYTRCRASEENCLRTTEQLAEFLKSKFLGADRERALLMALDSRSRVKSVHWLKEGNARMVSLEVKDVVSAALRGGTESVVLCHNHPNGVPLPSREDLAATENIVRALGLVKIRLRDHIILAENDYFSMRESNRLPFYDFETGAMLRPYGRE